MAAFLEPPQNFSVGAAKKWRPRMKSGYFYIQDREYYLYARKVTQQLKDITFTQFELEHDPVSINSLKVSGVEYSNKFIAGKSVIVNHRDLDAFATLWLTLEWDEDFWDYVLGAQFEPDTEVCVEYNYCAWNSVTESFDVLTNTEVIKVKDGNTDYRFQVPPVPGSPIVITDDLITDGNGIGYAPKFAVDYCTGHIKFHGKNNKIQNSDFSKWEVDGPGLHPSDWIESSGISGQSVESWYGQYALIPPAGSYVFQQPDVTSDNAQFFGAWVDGSGCIAFNYVDSSGNYLDQSGVQVATGGSPTFQSQLCFETSGWSRVTAVFGGNECYSPLHNIPVGTSSIEVRLYGVAKFDAITMLDGYQDRDYVNHHPNMTIEYEIDPSGLYTYDPTGVYILNPVPEPSGSQREVNVFPLPDINLNPITRERHNGFLYIEDDLELLDSGQTVTKTKTDFQLGYGGFQSDGSGGVEFTKGRQHFPYAKLRGKGKYCQTQFEWEQNEAFGNEVTEYEVHGNFLDIVKKLEIDPPVGSFMLSGKLTVPIIVGEAIEISAVITDGLGNGVLARPIPVSATNGLLDPLVVFSKMSGRAIVKYMPPATIGTETVTFTYGPLKASIDIIVQNPPSVSPEL